MRRTALAMVGRTSVDFEVMAMWINTLRKVHWPGPCYLMPEIYAAGAWIGVVPARNYVTYMALQRADEWDSILWIDADHLVSTGIIERIEEVGHLPIVCGPYFGREYPFEIQAFDLAGPEEGPKGTVKPIDSPRLVPLLQSGRPALLEVAGGGTGCMLIRKDVLVRMAELRGAPDIWRADRIPWEWQRTLIEQGRPASGVMTEDILFCLDVREHLGEVTHLDLDPRMETGHIRREATDRRTYLAAHVVPEGVNLDRAALERAGYKVTPLNRKMRRQMEREAGLRR